MQSSCSNGHCTVFTFPWAVPHSPSRSLVFNRVWTWLAAQGLWVQGEVMPACSQVLATPCSVFFEWCFTTWLVWLKGLTCMQITWANSAGKMCAKQTFWNEMCHSFVSKNKKAGGDEPKEPQLPLHLQRLWVDTGLLLNFVWKWPCHINYPPKM